jgi:SAM-dependent methyltransferase
LLDVACGTGGHLLHLRTKYAVEGLDLDSGMIAMASQRLPDVPLHQADMVDFDLGRQFDVVQCLFSSIGYVRTLERLRAAVATMARHLVSGGLLIVEPWFAPRDWRPGSPHGVWVDLPHLKVARINVSAPADHNLSVLDFHYLVATSRGVHYFGERHELGLFTEEQYRSAFEHAALKVVHDPDGPTGRGIYIGVSG